MIRQTAAVFAVVAMAGGAAPGMLLPITFDEFSQHASCAVIVEVTAIEELTIDEVLELGVSASQASGLNRLARLQIERWLVENGCAGADDSAVLAFSTEVHSSSPEVGHRYVLVPRTAGNTWLEAIYGRSAWEITPDENVLITYSNDFLIGPVDLRSGEIGRVPLAAIERLLTQSLHPTQP